MAAGVKRILWTLWRIRNSLVIVLVPILALPLPLYYETRWSRCAYAVLIMAAYWITEAIPMAVTALLPVALMPWLGVASAKQLSSNYLKDTNMIFLGGLIVAVAVEKWNLHKRIALRVLLLVGSRPRWLMFGFMTTTAFLSMWISNTATAAMMVPIVQAVLTELGGHRKKLHLTDDASDTNSLQMEVFKDGRIEKGATEPKMDVLQESDLEDCDGINSKAAPLDDEDEDSADELATSVMVTQPAEETNAEAKRFSDLCKGLTLCIAYGANIGGTATLTGTGPNVIMKGQIDVIFGDDTGISFSSWFIYAFPNMLVSLTLAWFLLQIYYLGLRETFSCFLGGGSSYDDQGANVVIRNEYNKLGPVCFAEGAVLVHFIVMALLWLSREPEFMPGWGSLLGTGFVTDGTIAITVSFFLFLFPSEIPNYLRRRKGAADEVLKPSPPLLDWQSVHHKMPWGLILVLGGGFALADGCKESGLSDVIGSGLVGLGSFPAWGMVFVLCIVTSCCTEIASNSATASLILPIMAQVAVNVHVNPLYLMIPATIASSFAFSLPVATPPNAIVFSFGFLTVKDMVKTGVIMNVLCLLVVQISINTWGYAYFGLGEFPAWAEKAGHGNITTSSPLLNDTWLNATSQ